MGGAVASSIPSAARVLQQFGDRLGVLVGVDLDDLSQAHAYDVDAVVKCPRFPVRNSGGHFTRAFGRRLRCWTPDGHGRLELMKFHTPRPGRRRIPVTGAAGE
jgi:hypothetical protein